MATANQGPVPPNFTFVNGSDESNIFVKVGGTTPALSLQPGPLSVVSADDSASVAVSSSGITMTKDSGTEIFVGNINLDVAGTMTLAGDDGGMAIYPSGATAPLKGLALSATGSAVTVAPSAAGLQQIIIPASQPVKILNVNAGTQAVGYSFAGVSNWVTVSGAGTFNLQFAGGVTFAPGTVFDFYLNGASTAGAIVTFSVNATTIASIVPATAAPANGCAFVRIFTPDGTTFVRAKMNFD
jgi:hypothetical protein